MSRELLKQVVQVYEKYHLDKYIHEDDEYLFDEIKEILKKPEPEPVVWMYEQNGEHWFQMYTPIDDVENYIPLYTN